MVSLNVGVILLADIERKGNYYLNFGMKVILEFSRGISDMKKNKNNNIDEEKEKWRRQKRKQKIMIMVIMMSW